MAITARKEVTMCKPRAFRPIPPAALFALFFGLGSLGGACNTSTGAGAAKGSGGANVSGGTVANTGGSGAGGSSTVTASGGAIGSGGVTSNGGATVSGGTKGSGGVFSTGGATVSGGVQGSGGASSTGGATSTTSTGGAGGGQPDARPPADATTINDGTNDVSPRLDASPDLPVILPDAVQSQPDAAVADAGPPPTTGIFVAPTGLDTNPGTLAAPYKTLTKALSVAQAGSQIWVRGGIFTQTATIALNVSGTAGNLLKIWAYSGESPVFDFTGQAVGDDGLSISANYVHLKGVEVAKAGHNGIRVSGGNNIVEQCKLHDCGNSGMLIRGVGAGNNLILNCDSYFNFDGPIGGNADGFSAKWEQGAGNVFRGCRSYNNSDDGWDLWMADHSIVLDNCWAFNNGVNSWNSASFAGNGNGIKLGGNQVATPHTVTNCMAFNNTGNGGKGFDENNNLAGQTLYNCTAFGNTNPNFSFTNTVTTGAHVFANCVSHKGTMNITSGTQKNNSWQNGLTVADADFQSLAAAQALNPRAADGSLPAITFMHLAPGSDLINAGTDVGLPFNGSAPDLGCFESP
jgi:Right handed beta helix region